MNCSIGQSRLRESEIGRGRKTIETLLGIQTPTPTLHGLIK
jgi:hypothetical protein